MGKEKTKPAKKSATMPLVNIGFINNTKIANQVSDARYPILVNGFAGQFGLESRLDWTERQYKLETGR